MSTPFPPIIPLLDLTPRERCDRLIAALRAEMPENFKWDFSSLLVPYKSCGTAGCALGLATTLGYAPLSVIIFKDRPELFGMEQDDYRDTFFRACTYDEERMNDVTPIMVAEHLEYLLDEGRAGKEPE